MSMNEIRNITARCVDKSSNDEIVLHQVSYEYKDSGVWVSKTVSMYATDPQDAINTVVRRNG